VIPYVDLAALHAPLRDELLAAVGRVLDHGQFILGPEVAELEGRLAERLEVPAVVGVANGTDALILALELRGIGPGDEVITVSHSFVATGSAILRAGARPVFVDLSEATMLMDPAAVEAAVTPRTRAVMPVHLNGQPCDLPAIAAVCRQHGLALIEDCAQAFGARAGAHSGGSPVGRLDLGWFSLHPLKVLPGYGDGGFIACASPADAERLRRLRNLGLIDRDHCGTVSGNSRLDTVQAAMLLVALDRFDDWVERRRAHATVYRQALAGVVRLPPEEAPGERITYSAFVVRHPERDRLAALLRERGVDAKAHYPLAIHQQPAFEGGNWPPLPVTERVVSEILSLPVHAALGDDDVRRVAEAVRSAAGELSA
jgi:dTDP-4-amino-4,6-dideoxygalactose transaminase